MAIVVVAAVAAFALVASSQGSGAGVALDPSAFAPGACMAYSPTHGDRNQTVFLDAGHGGIDPGGVGATSAGRVIDEATVNLAIELAAMKRLRAEGFRVVVSRTRQTTVVRLRPADVDGALLSIQGAHDDVVARDVCADLARANVLVGIYMDAGASASDSGGLTAYDPDRPFSAANLRLATLLQTDTLKAMNAQGWAIPDDGVESDTTLGSYVAGPASSSIAAQAAAYDHLLLIGPRQSGFADHPSTMPGAVIEPLYLSDPFEGTIAAGRDGQTVIADAIAAAVRSFLTRR